MNTGERIRSLRERKGYTQGDVEKRSGLLRCYISRVEHGHIMPSLENLEKIAWAIEVPLYELFRETGNPVPTSRFLTAEEVALPERSRSLWEPFAELVNKLSETDQERLLVTARQLLNKA